MNYNPLAEGKFRLLGIPDPVSGRTTPYGADEMRAFRSILREAGAKNVL